MNQETANSMFRLCRDTGKVYWLVSRGSAMAGDEVGCPDRDGYLRTKINGRQCRLHSLVWLLVNGVWPSGQIDHRNGVRTDNRPVNLREADRFGNSQNCKIPATNTSGFKGVGLKGGRWRAQIRAAGTNKHLGYFDTPELAKQAYDRAANELFGEFVRT